MKILQEKPLKLKKKYPLLIKLTLAKKNINTQIFIAGVLTPEHDFPGIEHAGELTYGIYEYCLINYLKVGVTSTWSLIMRWCRLVFVVNGLINKFLIN